MNEHFTETKNKLKEKIAQFLWKVGSCKLNLQGDTISCSPD